MKRAFWIGGAVVVAILAVLGIVAATSGESDEVLIRRTLDESLKATREGAPGSLYGYLSRNLQVNGQEIGRDPEISQFVKKLKPEVTLGPYSPVVEGNRATVTTSANVSFSLGPYNNTQPLDQVVIEFAKEPATKWGIFPSHRWRIVSVDAPNFTPPEY